MTNLVVNNVPVKSAWLSKVNWSAIIAPVVGLGAWLGYDWSVISAEMFEDIVAGAIALQTLITIFIRTYHTKDMVYQSAVALVGETPEKKTTKK